jgi:hypothetical protein
VRSAQPNFVSASLSAGLVLAGHARGVDELTAPSWSRLGEFFMTSLAVKEKI